MITLKSDFINVKCVEIDKNNQSNIIYQDFYAFARKLDIEKSIKSKQKEKYNVLMLGIDSMSIAHFVQSMRRTFDFLKANFWLAYPSLHTVINQCFSSKSMLGCVDEIALSDKTVNCIFFIYLFYFILKKCGLMEQAMFPDTYLGFL